MPLYLLYKSGIGVANVQKIIKKTLILMLIKAFYRSILIKTSHSALEKVEWLVPFDDIANVSSLNKRC